MLAIGLPLASSPARASPDSTTVGRAIAERRERVAEFRVIREAAQELGFRVWLFGGTAAAFAHYVRWDLARETGDARYRDAFFDYDFTNIYRSTQDADLVLDATPEEAERLEGLIRGKMGFLQGSKEHWEVRLLRQPRRAGSQVKLPLLGNPDFLEQHTDSNSTGMIELTDPPPGESVVRDLRDWDNPFPFFLTDVACGSLHYYWSPTHETTSRYLAGDNPPIFSVIRYLVKAFQYDLVVEGGDLERVRSIIDAFDPERDFVAMSPWARGWLERYGPNLIRHSLNVEYAWNTLEELGLRKKLIALSDPSRMDTLGWWLSREPLRTGPVGTGSGETAGELGLALVAHETRDFLAYESITRDTTLRPNVLVSRPGRPGESAANGEGFYTQIGRVGARGTGLTIRFAVDPRAREGTDFTLHGGFVVFHNRAALRVIPESLDESLVDYFRLLASGAADPSDRGAWMKLKRRISLKPLQDGEEDEVLSIVLQTIAKRGKDVALPLLREWFDLPFAAAHPEVIEALLPIPSVDLFLAREILTRSEWAPRPELRAEALTGAIKDTRANPNQVSPALEEWFASPVSKGYPGVVLTYIDRRASVGYVKQGAPLLQADRLLKNTLTDPGWVESPELIRAMNERGMGLVVMGILSNPAWSGHLELLLDMIDHLPLGWAQIDLLVRLLEQPHWRGNPAPLARILGRGGLYVHSLAKLLPDPAWSGHPELVLALLDYLDAQPSQDLRNMWAPGLEAVLAADQWRDDPHLRELCGGAEPNPPCLRKALRRETLGGAAQITRRISSLPRSAPSAECGPE